MDRRAKIAVPEETMKKPQLCAILTALMLAGCGPAVTDPAKLPAGGGATAQTQTQPPAANPAAEFGKGSAIGGGGGY